MGEAGMKKIGLISLDKSSSCAALREKGMQKALDEYGMKVVAEARDSSRQLTQHRQLKASSLQIPTSTVFTSLAPWA